LNITAIGPAVLGVTGADHPQGFLVQAVTQETGARRAGLDEQDIITRLDGLKVKSFSDVTLALFDKRPGAKVQVEYLRGGKRHTVGVVLTDRESVPDAAPAPYSQPVQMYAPAVMPAIFGFER
jgi:S1-C subfamily serine protease